jgi:hypothetical protein
MIGLNVDGVINFEDFDILMQQWFQNYQTEW